MKILYWEFCYGLFLPILNHFAAATAMTIFKEKLNEGDEEGCDRPRYLLALLPIQMDISGLHRIGATYLEATLGVALEYRYELPRPFM